tara:strand:+ start:218 stop:433 length:216 start_codon:yes stop_codon:yes gene_type:complete
MDFVDFLSSVVGDVTQSKIPCDIFNTAIGWIAVSSTACYALTHCVTDLKWYLGAFGDEIGSCELWPVTMIN